MDTLRAEEIVLDPEAQAAVASTTALLAEQMGISTEEVVVQYCVCGNCSKLHVVLTAVGLVLLAEGLALAGTAGAVTIPSDLWSRRYPI